MMGSPTTEKSRYDNEDDGGGRQHKVTIAMPFGRQDHLAPLFGVVDDELAKVARRIRMPMRGRVLSATHHRRGSDCMRDDGTTDFERSDRIAAARKRYRLWSWTTLARGVMVTLILETDRAEYAAIPA
jgi:hypothetical protein